MKLSLIIPTYNSERYLDELLQSIRDIPWYEIIFVDDGSIDRTLEIIKEFKNDNHNIKVIRDMHRGASSSRNMGLSQATGDYIMFMDSDDLLESQPLISFIQNQEVLSDITLFTSTAGDEYRYQLSSYREQDLIENILKLPSVSKNKKFIFDSGPCSRIYRRSLLVDNCIKFNNNIKFGEDLLFNIMAIKQANTVSIIPLGIYLYRYNADSVSRGLKYDQVVNAKLFFEQLDTLVDPKIVNERRALSFIRNIRKALKFKQKYSELIRLIDFYKNKPMDIIGFSFIQKLFFYLSIYKRITMLRILIKVKDYSTKGNKIKEFTKI